MFLSGENTLAIRFDALHRAFGGGQPYVCPLRSCVGSVGRLVFSAPISPPLRAKVFCLRIAGEKRGILAEKWGRKREKLPLFRCLLPYFSNRDTSPALSAGVFSPRASDPRKRCRGQTLQPTVHRAAAGTVCVGHATDAHHSRAHRPAARRRETKTPPVYENRPGAGIGMCRPRSRNCRATAQRLPLRLPKSPVNPRRRRKSL